MNRHSFSAGFHTTQVMDTLARAYIRKGESREGAAAGSLVSGRGGDRTVGGLGYLDGCGLWFRDVVQPIINPKNHPFKWTTIIPKWYAYGIGFLTLSHSIDDVNVDAGRPCAGSAFAFRSLPERIKVWNLLDLEKTSGTHSQTCPTSKLWPTDTNKLYKSYLYIVILYSIILCYIILY